MKVKIHTEKLAALLANMSEGTGGGIIVKTRCQIGTLQGVPVVLELNADPDETADLPAASGATRCVEE